MVGADALGSKLQCLSLMLGNLSNQRLNLLRRKAQSFRRQRQTIIAFGELNNRRISARAHIRNNLGNSRVHIRAVLTFRPQKGGKLLFKVWRCRVKKLWHGSSFQGLRPS